MGFRHVTCGIDLVVHCQHRAFILRLRINSNTDCIQQIARAVKIGHRGIALRADKNNGFARFNGQIKPIRCFFQGIRTV
ncbi:Uncharacterised protein [Mycobacterium tuberculosis]|nr:Uncharacterised protein [Mycobacterium tuberculosis]